MTHINHLQQLIPHHQVQQPPPPTPPSVLPPPPTPVPSPPEQPTLPVATPSPPIAQPTFNPEEMLNQMKTTFQESLAAAVDKAQERQSQQLSPPILPFLTPSHSDSHLPPATSKPGSLITTFPLSSSAQRTSTDRQTTSVDPQKSSSPFTFTAFTSPSLT